MTGPDPAVAEVRRVVRADLSVVADEHGPGALVLVACSGGADSLALAAAAGWEAPRLGVRAGVVVVDHQWHPDSAAVADGAAAACRQLHLDPVRVSTTGLPGRSLEGPAGAARPEGPEGAARAARYAVLEQVRAETGAVAVLLGHTADDQAETVLLGLARGSGTRSLAGMAAVRGRLRRPLLQVTRARTTACCAALGLRPASDPSNADPRLARTRVRHRVLPVLEAELGPGVAAALVRTARATRDDADYLDVAAALLAATVTAADTTLDCAGLVGAAPALRRRVLRAAALAAGSPAADVTAGHVDALEALLLDWHGQRGVDLPGRVRAVRREGRLVLAGPGRGMRAQRPTPAL